MRKIPVSLFLSVCILLTVSISHSTENCLIHLANEINSIEKNLKTKTVAVLPFKNLNSTEKISGTSVSEKIIHELVKRGKLKVVERTRIDKIIKELKLELSGLINTDKAVKIGKLLAVDALITGSINNRENKTEIFVRVIDVESGLILKTAECDYAQVTENEAGLTGTWIVTRTAPYFRKHKLQYRKLKLGEDSLFELELINNAERVVLFKGYYKINGNNIDFSNRELYIDGQAMSRPGSRWLKGTVYRIKGKLYFTVTDMKKKNKKRLDAMKPEFRNIAERKKR